MNTEKMDHEKIFAVRRALLKLAAVSALGSLSLPGCSSSSADAAPTKTITILGIVDVAQALADNSLDNNIYWMDNNASAGSQYLGTGHLKTAISRGSAVQWIVSGLQVETVADIAEISGSAVAIANPVLTTLALGFSFWTGQIANSASGLHTYAIKLKVENRLMNMSSPLSLEIL